MIDEIINSIILDDVLKLLNNYFDDTLIFYNYDIELIEKECLSLE